MEHQVDPGVSLNELTFEFKEEESANTLVLDQPFFNQYECVDEHISNIFTETQERKKRDNVLNAEEFEDCCLDISPHLLFKSTEVSHDSDLDFDFLEITQPSTTLHTETQENILLPNTSTNSEPVILKSVANELAVDSGLFETKDTANVVQDLKSIKNWEQCEIPKTASEEWETIQIVQPDIMSNTSVKGFTTEFETKPLVTFHEVWPQFESCDYSSVQSHIKTTIHRRGFSAFTFLLFGPPKLHRDLLPQRDLLFCIAATSFQNDNVVHIQVLQTIFRCLTGSKFECQRFGNHWEEIGFQGNDPATDLRGVGMLALLQILFFIRDPHTKELAREVYKLSLHPIQNFPFCVMGINITRICLQVLREELFNKECNKRKDVVVTVNYVFASLFYFFYEKWVQGKTIADSGFILQDTENYARKHYKSVIKDFENGWKPNKKNSNLKVTQDQLSFLDLCPKEDKKMQHEADLY